MPTAAQLYYSSNGGRWQMNEQVAPQLGHFKFRAPADGEWLFCVRTTDYRGQSIDQGQLKPELRVLVDTQKPALSIRASRWLESADGITVSWDATDKYVNPESAVIKYQVAGSTDWQTIPVPLESMGYRIPPPASGTESVWYAVPIEEARHNWSAADRYRIVGKVNVGAPANREVIVQAEISDIAGNRSISKAIVPAAAPANNSQPNPNDQTNANRPPAPQWRKDGSRIWPPNHVTQAPIGQQAPTPTSPMLSPSNPPFAEQVSPPPKIPIKQVDSTRFDLAYNPGAPTQNIVKVDLWGTADGGEIWNNFGSDTDRQSPVLVTVPSEGRYGFRIVVQSTANPRPALPVRGDAPQIWIDVNESGNFSAPIRTSRLGISDARVRR
jgi:hypothetical protein